MFKNKIINKAFTMAEAILVMTILGIIATIMITTIQPAEFKQKAQKILKKKVFSEIDHAMTQIIINNTKSGQLDRMFLDDASDPFYFTAELPKTEKLFKKYLATTRKEYNPSTKMGSFSLTVDKSPTLASQSPPFYLKNGAIVFLGAAERYNSWPIVVEGCEIYPDELVGLIVVDINGEDEPNVPYQDQFYFPINKNGIDYDQMCMEAPGDGTIYDCDLVLQKAEEKLGHLSSHSELTESVCLSLGDGWKYATYSYAASLTPQTPVARAESILIASCRHSYCGYDLNVYE